MRINIIGSGNVATHLGRAIMTAGHEVACVVSRDAAHAQGLASAIHAQAMTSVALAPQADVTLIAVNDNAIANVAAELRKHNVSPIVAHTSGATPMDCLAGLPHRGVFYPCQTFSKGDDVRVSEVPFLIEASDPLAENTLTRLAKSIGSCAIPCDSAQRALLHLAAVFASNFTNHLLLQADEIMRRAGLPTSILRPLVEKTVSKAFDMGAKEAQTGPARRLDSKTLEAHRRMTDSQCQAAIYDTLTRSILATYHPDMEQ